MAKRTSLRDLYAKLQDHNIRLVIMQAFLKLVCMMKKCCKLIKYSLFKKATLVSNVIHFYREDGTEITSVDLSSIAVSDKYLSNILHSGNTYTFKLNNGTTVGSVTVPEIPEIPEEVYIESAELDGNTLKLNYNVNIDPLEVDLSKFIQNMPVVPGYYFSSEPLSSTITHSTFNKLEFIGPDLLRHPDNDTNHRYIYLINSLTDVKKVEEYRIMVKDHIYFVVSEVGSGTHPNSDSIVGRNTTFSVNDTNSFTIPYGEVCYFKYGKINPDDQTPQVYLKKTSVINLNRILNLYGLFDTDNANVNDIVSCKTAFTADDPLIMIEDTEAAIDENRPQIGTYYNIANMFGSELSQPTCNLSSRGHNASVKGRTMYANPELNDAAVEKIYRVFNGVDKVLVVDSLGNSCGYISNINSRYNYILAIPISFFNRTDSGNLFIEPDNPSPSDPNVAYIQNRYELKNFGESTELQSSDGNNLARVYLDLIDKDTNGLLFFPSMFSDKDTNTYICNMQIVRDLNHAFYIELKSNMWLYDSTSTIEKIKSEVDSNVTLLLLGQTWPWSEITNASYKDNSLLALGRITEYILAHCFNCTTSLSGNTRSIYDIDYNINCGWTNKWKHYTFDFRDCDLHICLNVEDLYFDNAGEFLMQACLDIVYNNPKASPTTNTDYLEILRIKCKIGSYVRDTGTGLSVIQAYSVNPRLTVTGIGYFLPKVTIENVSVLRTYLGLNNAVTLEYINVSNT